MSRPLSSDLRERVVAAVTDGESCRAVGARFGVAASSVVKWSQRYRATSSVSPGKMGGRRKPLLEPHRAFLFPVFITRYPPALFICSQWTPSLLVLVLVLVAELEFDLFTLDFSKELPSVALLDLATLALDCLEQCIEKAMLSPSAVAEVARII
jgi:transposase